MKTVKEPTRTDRVRAALLKRAFEALYGPFAWAYDWVSNTFFLGQWRLWQRASLRFLQGKRVLEVGMGTGNLHVDLVRGGYEAWGLDYSPQMLRQAAARSRRLGIQFNMCRAKAQALPFSDAHFDSVVSTFPSDYIVQPETLDEVYRVLRPGGRLVIVPGGSLAPRNGKSKALEGVARLVYGNASDPAPAGERLMRQVESHASGSAWIAVLGQRMSRAGFQVSAHIASNERGAALVVVGVKPPRPATDSM